MIDLFGIVASAALLAALVAGFYAIARRWPRAGAAIQLAIALAFASGAFWLAVWACALLYPGTWSAARAALALAIGAALSGVMLAALSDPLRRLLAEVRGVDPLVRWRRH